MLRIFKKRIWVPKDPEKVTVNDMELAAQMGYVPTIRAGKLIHFRRK